MAALNLPNFLHVLLLRLHVSSLIVVQPSKELILSGQPLVLSFYGCSLLRQTGLLQVGDCDVILDRLSLKVDEKGLRVLCSGGVSVGLLRVIFSVLFSVLCWVLLCGVLR